MEENFSLMKKLGYKGFDYVNYFVGNALQAASYYNIRFGFENIAYKGLSTGEKKYATHVIKQGNIFLSFTSSLTVDDDEFANHLKIHGDAIKDVGFTVDDCNFIYKHAISNGAKSIQEPTITSDEYGYVITASIATPVDDVIHTFVERNNYKGKFLPGYSYDVFQDPLSKLSEPVGLMNNDHIVYCLLEKEMNGIVQWYKDTLGFHEYWSADSEIVTSDVSGLNSTVVADYNNSVKFPVNEAVNKTKKSQTQEFVEFGGRGCQHFALTTNNLIHSVEQLKKRGVEFIPVPKLYYSGLKQRMEKCTVEVKEDIKKLEEMGIFLDFDKQGYLLQMFTKTVEDKPTFMVEIIQRTGHSFGFGEGNFKAIFNAIENEQRLRNTLDL